MVVIISSVSPENSAETAGNMFVSWLNLPHKHAGAGGACHAGTRARVTTCPSKRSGKLGQLYLCKKIEILYPHPARVPP